MQSENEKPRVEMFCIVNVPRPRAKLKIKSAYLPILGDITSKPFVNPRGKMLYFDFGNSSSILGCIYGGVFYWTKKKG